MVMERLSFMKNNSRKQYMEKPFMKKQFMGYQFLFISSSI